MNKYFFLLISCVFCVGSTLFAQPVELNYGFALDTMAYQSLSKPIGSATVIDTFDPGTRIQVPIGFNFGFAGQMFTELTMRPQGEISLGNPQQNPGEAWTIVGFGANLVDKSTDGSGINSELRYRLDGDLGSRILKLEWYRMGFYWGDSTDEMSLQIWLHEQDYRVTMHYGAFQIADSMNVFDISVGYPSAGLLHIDWNTEEAIGVYLSGAGHAPTPIVHDGHINEYYLTSAPDSGTVYQFCPGGNCDRTSTGLLDQPQVLAAKLFPNPATDLVTIQFPGNFPLHGTLRLLDLTGRIVHQEVYSGQGEYRLSVGHHPAGLYQLQLETADRAYQAKLRIQ